MSERLQKLISAAGLCSRRAAEELIKAGKVTVNGNIAKLGDSAEPATDYIEVDGKAIEAAEKYTYIMLNKPRGYVTTLSDERGRKTVAELVRDCGARVYPCGRLDMASEGLLILTNDGMAANRLTHPSSEIQKTYRVSVRGKKLDAGIDRLSGEFTLDGVKLYPARIQILSIGDGSGKEDISPTRAVLLMTIHEGKNRQLRRMCELAKLEVTRLIRQSEGELSLGSLRTGHWRRLSDGEIKYLKG